MESGELLFVPLGGAGEIGMNLGLYGFGGKWMMVDLGIAFGDEMAPGVDVTLPDPAFIAEQRGDLVGIVITHAHEDHIGAVPYLWRRLRSPVYCTPFAAAMLRRKLLEAGLDRDVPVTIVPRGGTIEVGPFTVRFIPAAHSIPEGNILAIQTPVGRVVHATDWRIDPHPVIGPPTNEAALRRLGDEGVLAMVCDSTNVFVPGESGSEGDVRRSLADLISRYDQRIAVACFASNVARVETIAHAAAANGRSTALIGRSLWNVTEAAREVGYLAETEPFLPEQEAAWLPRERALYIVTGSQGEPRSALARIANDDHPNIVLEEGDAVIFSSRIIPGNEKAIGRIMNRLANLGVQTVTADDHFVHVSGHPARDELEQLYSWIRPQIAVPCHGEARHLLEHAHFAGNQGVPYPVVAENGSVLRLAPEAPQIVDYVTSGRLVMDGIRVLPLEGEVMRVRRRLAFAGVAVATLVLDGNGRLVGDPTLAVPGLLGSEDEGLLDLAIDAVIDAVSGLRGGARRDNDAVIEAARLAIRRTLRDVTGKRPHTEVQVVRV